MRIEDIDFSRKYLYSHSLNKHEQRLYRFMVERILNREYTFLQAFSDARDYVPDSSFSYPTFWLEDNYEADFDITYLALRADFPEFFFICIEPVFDPDTFLTSIDAGYTEEEIEDINLRLEAFCHIFDDVPTGFELEVAVADYIVEHFDYEYNYKSFTGRASDDIHTVAGLMLNGRGVCDGISRLAQYVMQRRGMEAILAISNPPNKDESHAWLIVKLDGRYYHLDITEHEGTSNDRDYIQRSLFNVTDADMLKAHPHYFKRLYKDILCNSYRDNYYHRMGLYYNTEEKIIAAISEQIERQRGAGDEGRFCFKTPKHFAQKQLKRCMQTAVNRTSGNVGLYRASCDGYHIIGIIYYQKG